MDNHDTKVLVTIVQHGHAKKLMKHIDHKYIIATVILKGEGTVNPMMYASLVNLTTDSKRDVLLSLVKTEHCTQVQDAFYKIGKLDKKHTGITFTLPINEVIGKLNVFKEDAL